MNAWTIALTTVSVSAVAFPIAIGLSCLWPPDHNNDEHPITTTHRTHAADVNPYAAQEFLSSCTAPARPLSIAEAHREMQLHRECRCVRQRFALQTLIEAGRIKPDSHREPPQSWTL